MRKIQNRPDGPGADFLGVFIAAVVAFALGLVIYGPLAAFEFTLFVFEDFSVAKIVGSWSVGIKFVSATIFGILSGFSSYVLAHEWNPPFPIRLHRLLFSARWV